VVCVSLLLLFVLLPASSAQDLNIEVTGDAATFLALNAGDPAAMPLDRVDVIGSNGAKTMYEGVALQEILKRAGISSGHGLRGKALSGYVLAKANDGYEVVFSLGSLAHDLRGERVLVANKRDGKRLTPNQGPVRLFLPGDKEGPRSERMFEKLEVVKLQEQ
jgi:DMSO/TMAO reductase YedYZ molybdopterin-dependent catalytic subunit